MSVINKIFKKKHRKSIEIKYIDLPSTDYSDLESENYSDTEEEDKINEKLNSKIRNKLDVRFRNIKEKLIKFLTIYNPTKLKNVPSVVEYLKQGHKSYESIQENLMQKYNANLDNLDYIELVNY